MTEVVDVIDGLAYERRDVPGCPLCGRRRPPRKLSARFGMVVYIVECVECRVAYQSPRPSVDASLAYMEMRWRSSDVYVADAYRQRARAESQLSLLATLFDRPGRALDFGAGIGTFVGVAREHGWETIGVERSASARARAHEERGVELVKDLRQAPRNLDLVTLWDVIEHLREPEAMIADLSSHLRPGGWMVLETGNWESWARLAMGDAWGLYLFDHQYYFTPSSLEAITVRAGLREFRLLNREQRPAPAEPGVGAEPDAVGRWEAFQRGSGLWPEHAGIDIMVAAARLPASSMGPG